MTPAPAPPPLTPLDRSRFPAGTRLQDAVRQLRATGQRLHFTRHGWHTSRLH